jgi:large subunit ribosomal protein L15
MEKKDKAFGLHDLKPAEGSKNKRAFRVGRGQGSGNGKTAGRGHKGAQSRSGFKFKRGFEGGQMPLHRRVPKRGFTNIFRIEFAVVHVDRIAEVFDAGSVVTPELLQQKGLVARNAESQVLARGDVEGPDHQGAQVQRQGGRKSPPPGARRKFCSP